MLMFKRYYQSTIKAVQNKFYTRPFSQFSRAKRSKQQIEIQYSTWAPENLENCQNGESLGWSRVQYLFFTALSTMASKVRFEKRAKGIQKTITQHQFMKGRDYSSR